MEHQQPMMKEPEPLTICQDVSNIIIQMCTKVLVLYIVYTSTYKILLCRLMTDIMRSLAIMFILLCLLLFLKGQCHEIIDSPFFLILTHIGPLFLCWSILYIVSISRRYSNQAQRFKLLGVNDYVESNMLYIILHSFAFIFKETVAQNFRHCNFSWIELNWT